MVRVVILLLFFLGVNLALSCFALLMGGMAHQTTDMIYQMFMPWVTIVSSALTILFLFVTKSIPLKNASFWGIKGRSLLLCTPLMLSAIVALSMVSELVALPNLNEDAFEAMVRNPWGVFAIVVAGPLGEELLFRGGIEGHLLRMNKRPELAIGISSLLFALVHGNPAQIPFALLIGSLLGWIYYRTGSVLPGFFFHVVNNGLAVGLMLYCPEVGVRDLWGTMGCWAILIPSALFFVCDFLYVRKRL